MRRLRLTAQVLWISLVVMLGSFAESRELFGSSRGENAAEVALRPLYNTALGSFPKSEQERLLTVLRGLGISYQTDAEGRILVESKSQAEIRALIEQVYRKRELPQGPSGR